MNNTGRINQVKLGELRVYSRISERVNLEIAKILSITPINLCILFFNQLHVSQNTPCSQLSCGKPFAFSCFTSTGIPSREKFHCANFILNKSHIYLFIVLLVYFNRSTRTPQIFIPWDLNCFPFSTMKSHVLAQWIILDAVTFSRIAH